jgi:hypothetical protein
MPRRLSTDKAPLGEPRLEPFSFHSARWDQIAVQGVIGPGPLVDLNKGVQS